LNLIKESVKLRGKHWCLLKLAEECNELAASIMQHMTKGTLERYIIEEGIHVEIALEHLNYLYDEKELNKLKSAIKKDKYKQIAKKIKEEKGEK
jgi:hypothetical protein